MRLFSILVLTTIIIGCVTTKAEYIEEPKPASPEQPIAVSIDSIPSGADVYVIEDDGNLGKKIGVTPFVHKIGTSTMYYTAVRGNEKKREPSNLSFKWLYGEGLYQEMIFEPYRHLELYLKLAFVKGHHSIAAVKKEIRYRNRIFEEGPPKTMALTVPLQTIEQVNFERQLKAQERANKRQYNINIEQSQDSLDNVNSALDALIKMKGLGVMR